MLEDLSFSGGWPHWFWRTWDNLPLVVRTAIKFAAVITAAFILGRLAVPTHGTGGGGGF